MKVQKLIYFCYFYILCLFAAVTIPKRTLQYILCFPFKNCVTSSLYYTFTFFPFIYLFASIFMLFSSLAASWFTFSSCSAFILFFSTLIRCYVPYSSVKILNGQKFLMCTVSKCALFFLSFFPASELCPFLSSPRQHVEYSLLDSVNVRNAFHLQTSPPVLCYFSGDFSYSCQPLLFSEFVKRRLFEVLQSCKRPFLVTLGNI